MKKIHACTTAGILLLGLVHISLTPYFYPGSTENSVWFAGTGFSLVFLAALNFVFYRESFGDRWADRCLHGTNVVAFFFFVWMAYRIREPQAWITVALQAAVLASAYRLRRIPIIQGVAQ